MSAVHCELPSSMACLDVLAASMQLATLAAAAVARVAACVSRALLASGNKHHRYVLSEVCTDNLVLQTQGRKSEECLTYLTTGTPSWLVTKWWPLCDVVMQLSQTPCHHTHDHTQVTPMSTVCFSLICSNQRAESSLQRHSLHRTCAWRLRVQYRLA